MGPGSVNFEGGMGEKGVEFFAHAERGGCIGGAPENGGGGGDTAEFVGSEGAVGVEHVGKSMFHVFGSAGIIGSAEEFVGDLAKEGEIFERREEF